MSRNLKFRRKRHSTALLLGRLFTPIRAQPSERLSALKSHSKLILTILFPIIIQFLTLGTFYERAIN